MKPRGAQPAAGTYTGRRLPRGGTVVRQPDGGDLPLAPSRSLRDHSPTGFEWGYHGSGPAQLALAILLHHTGDTDRALAHYQTFKMEVVACWGGESWSLTPRQIYDWLDRCDDQERRAFADAGRH